MFITFTCPHCHGHRLQQIKQAIHRAEVNVTTASDGRLTAKPMGVIEELNGPVLGYRCRDCRYPDIRNHEDNGGFYWQTIEDVHAAACITIEEGVQHTQRCMICMADGKMEPILIGVNSEGPLSHKQRVKILEERNLKNAVLICESDPGIQAFTAMDWQGIETIFVSTPTP